MTTTVRQMLRNKPGVFAVRQDDTVYDALALMAEHNIGSVLVMDGPELRGIMTERDYARKGILQGRASKDTDGRRDHDAAHHLCGAGRDRRRMHDADDGPACAPPAGHGGRWLVGVISIGDVVRAVVEEQQSTIDALETYIRTA